MSTMLMKRLLKIEAVISKLTARMMPSA